MAYLKAGRAAPQPAALRDACCRAPARSGRCVRRLPTPSRAAVDLARALAYIPALQPAQLPGQLPRVGDAHPLGQPAGLRHRLQAGGLPHAKCAFNSKIAREGRARRVLRGVARGRLVVSFADEGYLDPAAGRGAARPTAGTCGARRTTTSATSARRSASTTPRASASGPCRHLRNTEHLIVCRPQRGVIAQVKLQFSYRLAGTQLAR